EHDPEKSLPSDSIRGWTPVFRKDRAPPKSRRLRRGPRAGAAAVEVAAGAAARPPAPGRGAARRPPPPRGRLPPAPGRAARGAAGGGDGGGLAACLRGFFAGGADAFAPTFGLPALAAAAALGASLVPGSGFMMLTAGIDAAVGKSMLTTTLRWPGGPICCVAD